MSIDHVSKVLRLPAEVTGTNRMVLLVLAEAANQDSDECWPSVGTIRMRAGLRQDRYVQKAIAALVELGLIEVDPNGCPDYRIPGNHRPNLYRMIGRMAVLVGDARRAPSDDVGGARRAPQGVRDAQDALHIEPEVEPNAVAADAARAEMHDAEGRTEDDPLYGFANWWAAYPKRRGRKVGKAAALEKWRHLSLEHRREVYRATLVYRAEIGDFARDPARFLTKFYWQDWKEQATSTPTDVAPADVAIGAARLDPREFGVPEHMILKSGA